MKILRAFQRLTLPLFTIKLRCAQVSKEPFEALIKNLDALKAGGDALGQFLEGYHRDSTKEKYYAMLAAAHELGISKVLEAALLFDSRKGYAHSVAFLVQKGVNVNLQDHKGKTPLLWAARWGHWWTINLLLDKGAVVDAPDNSGQTALMNAAAYGALDLVKFFIDKGARTDSVDKKGFTCLMCACSGGDPEVVQELLDRGAQVDAQDSTGRTALSYVARCGDNTKILKVLLKAQASVDMQDKKGRTALMAAASMGDKESVETLLAAKARVDIQDNTGKTAVDYAPTGNNTIKDLLNNDPTAPLIKPDAKKSSFTIERGLLIACTCYLSYELYRYYTRTHSVGDVKEQIEKGAALS